MTRRPSPSFRDPAGQLVLLDDCALRIVSREASSTVSEVLNSTQVLKLVGDGSLIAAEPCGTSEAASLLSPHKDHFKVPEGSSFLRHERIPFVSYPAEWPPEMLHAAASVTVEIMVALLNDGLGLKDASPYNVLFRGTTPVFVDFLSLEKRDASNHIWLGYAQFARMFLLPLLGSKTFDYPLEACFLRNQQGIEPEQLYRMASLAHFANPVFLSLVSVPTWLGALASKRDIDYAKHSSLDDPEKTRFVLRSLFWRLSLYLRLLRPQKNRESIWKSYVECNSYSDSQLLQKQEFVLRMLHSFSPGSILDIGCNTGFFSKLCARTGSKVVAIDSDEAVIGELYNCAREEQLDILPLVVNIARPTPAVGWRNLECSSFLERAKSSFHAVLMLAVVHHLLVTERIPLSEIFEVASQLTTTLLVIEFVAPDDPMFKKLARGRDHLHSWLTEEVFEHESCKKFRILEKSPITGTKRTLYLMEKLGE